MEYMSFAKFGIIGRGTKYVMVQFLKIAQQCWRIILIRNQQFYFDTIHSDLILSVPYWLF